MFSLEGPEGVRFLTRSRLFTDGTGGRGSNRRRWPFAAEHIAIHPGATLPDSPGADIHKSAQ
jgi:hypothetical protein